MQRRAMGTTTTAKPQAPIIHQTPQSTAEIIALTTGCESGCESERVLCESACMSLNVLVTVRSLYDYLYLYLFVHYKIHSIHFPLMR